MPTVFFLYLVCKHSVNAGFPLCHIIVVKYLTKKNIALLNYSGRVCYFVFKMINKILDNS